MRVLEVTDMTANDVKTMFADLNKKIEVLINERNAPQPQANEAENMTIDETTAFFRINRTTLWKWTKERKVTAYRIGSKKYYKRSEVQVVLNNAKTI